MKLRNVSRYFQRTSVYDGYTAALLFKAHLKSFDDRTSSGATSRRRTMTTDITYSAPARRVVQVEGEYWILGNSNLDTFDGSQVRKTFGMKKATDLATYRTPGQAALASGGSTLYIQREFYRDMTNPTTESEQDTQWNVFCPFTETVQVGRFFLYGSRLCRIRNVYGTVDEYLVAEADQLDEDTRQAVTFTTTGAYNLVTEAETAANISTYVIQTDVQKFYRFVDEAEAVAKPGDRTIFVAKSAVAANVGAKFTMLGYTWQVVTVQSEQDAWACRVRRV